MEFLIGAIIAVAFLALYGARLEKQAKRKEFVDAAVKNTIVIFHSMMLRRAELNDLPVPSLQFSENVYNNLPEEDKDWFIEQSCKATAEGANIGMLIRYGRWLAEERHEDEKEEPRLKAVK